MQISTVNFMRLNPEFRLDAEYYREEVLNCLHLFNDKKSAPLEQLVKFIVGPFGSTVTVDKYVEASEYKYIRNKDINDFVIKDDECAFIPYEVYNPLKQFHIKKNDLLITVVGTLGKVAIAQDKDSKSIFSCKSTVLRTIHINPYYLLAYLNSRIGQLFVLRGKRGAIQEGLNLTDLKEIQVYTPSDDFQQTIEESIKEAFSLFEQSKKLYIKAQSFLENEIGLSELESTSQKSFIRKFSEIFYADRLDAEYFQPRYVTLRKNIENICEKPGWYLTNVGSVSQKLKYGSSTKLNYIESGVPFLRIADLVNNKFDLETVKFISKSEAKNEPLVKTNDVLLSRSGTLGIAVTIPPALNNSIYGSYFIRIRLNDEKVSSKYLELFLNSKLGRLQVEQVNTGAIQTNLTIPVIESLLLAIPPKQVQDSLLALIEESELKEQCARKMLQLTKQSIEIAIKEDEIIAKRWLSEEIRKLR